jgi:hypothetical protein
MRIEKSIRNELRTLAIQVKKYTQNWKEHLETMNYDVPAKRKERRQKTEEWMELEFGSFFFHIS